jgi:hypothetical protein
MSCASCGGLGAEASGAKLSESHGSALSFIDLCPSPSATLVAHQNRAALIWGRPFSLGRSNQTDATLEDRHSLRVEVPLMANSKRALVVGAAAEAANQVSYAEGNGGGRVRTMLYGCT